MKQETLGLLYDVPCGAYTSHTAQCIHDVRGRSLGGGLKAGAGRGARPVAKGRKGGKGAKAVKMVVECNAT